MDIIFNDCSLNNKKRNIYELKDIFDNFIDILEMYKQITGRDLSVVYDENLFIYKIQLSDGKYMKDFIKELKKSNREKASYINTLFANKFRSIELPIHYGEVIIEEKYKSKSSIYRNCYEEDAILLSLGTDPIFINNCLKCQIEEKSINVLNIGQVNHLTDYWEYIDYLVYEHNSKHKFKEVLGGFVSAMDLNDSDAQKVLSNSVISKQGTKRRYGIHGKKYYEFKQHEKNKFHGYCNDKIPLDKKKELTQ